MSTPSVFGKMPDVEYVEFFSIIKNEAYELFAKRLSESLATIKKHSNALAQTLLPFRENYANLSPASRKIAIENLFQSFNQILNLKLSDKALRLEFHHSWLIDLRKAIIYANETSFPSETGDDTVCAFMHELGHALQHSGCEEGDKMANIARIARYLIDHHSFPTEVLATRFSFEVMREFGFDEKRTTDYDNWRKAFVIHNDISLLLDARAPKAAQAYISFYERIKKHSREFNNISGFLSYSDEDWGCGVNGKMAFLRYVDEIETELTDSRRELLEIYERLAEVLPPPQSMPSDKLLKHVREMLSDFDATTAPIRVAIDKAHKSKPAQTLCEQPII